jgi:hypothetical protein
MNANGECKPLAVLHSLALFFKNTGGPMTLDQELIQILRCPKCKGTLEQHEQPPSFVCQTCRLRFSIVDDIPNFILTDAQALDAE